MTGRRNRQNRDQNLTVSRMSGMGVELVGAIGTMALIGWLLDRWLGTEPWLIVTGLGVGLIAGMYRFFRTALSTARPRRSDSEKSESEGG